MIIVTGAAGFIGSCAVSHLLGLGHDNIVAVDNFERADKQLNLEGKSYVPVERELFIREWIHQNRRDIKFVFHLGARTDTTETDVVLFNKLNLNYSKFVWKACAENQIPLIYASSAATYGLGELGYEDRHDIVSNLKPLNPYGHSKNDFDCWALKQKQQPPFWAGLKFFNVYGPNEFHKGRMASVIFHTHKQIEETGGMRLFRSHKEGIADGQQKRDFIYIKDILKIMTFLHSQRPENGLYNLGTGQARSFYDLAENTFKAMGRETNISYIDTPLDIRNTYQYFTEANISKLRQAGYDEDFYSLEEGVEDYVKNYLIGKKYF